MCSKDSSPGGGSEILWQGQDSLSGARSRTSGSSPGICIAGRVSGSDHFSEAIV